MLEKISNLTTILGSISFIYFFYKLNEHGKLDKFFPRDGLKTVLFWIFFAIPIVISVALPSWLSIAFNVAAIFLCLGYAIGSSKGGSP